MQMNRLKFAIRVLPVILLVLPSVAHAYTGPGLGLGAISAALGVLGSILFALLAVAWYPFKRLVRKFRSKRDEKQ
jgi:hypothetical protein